MSAILNYLTDQVIRLISPGTLYRDLCSDIGHRWLLIGLGTSSLAAIELYWEHPKYPKREQLPLVITLYYLFLVCLGVFGIPFFWGLGVSGESSMFSTWALAWGSTRVVTKAVDNYNFFWRTLRKRVDKGNWSDEEKEIEKNRKVMMHYFRHYWYRWNITE